MSRRGEPGPLPMLALVLVAAVAPSARAESDALVVGTWGGAYEAAQRAALFDPYASRSGVPIETVPYRGGLSVFERGPVPDVLDMIEEDAIAACDRGLLERLDPADLVGRVPVTEEALLPCAVAHLTFSTLVAFDESAFPGEKPRRIEDLFDVERFPGKRALQRGPAAIFEWAMLAEGVPPSQVYDLLSTERGLRLVRRQLERLRGHVLWWSDPAEAVRLLVSGEASVASGYNGRFFDAWAAGRPIGLIWDGQIVDRSVWAVPSAGARAAPSPDGARDPEDVDRAGREARLDAATDFVRFAIAPVRQGALARLIPYGPVHPEAFRFVGLHPGTGIVMREHLPTAPHRLGAALFRDARWYARTEALRRRHFEAWLADTDP